jgi:pimeloyl-ACP methyl ester carboxylesterase
MLLEMAQAAAPPFVRWGLTAIMRWSFDATLEMPVHHIHGDRDNIIPVRGVKPDRIVPGAGHLMNVTHAEEVNAFVRERIDPA